MTDDVLSRGDTCGVDLSALHAFLVSSGVECSGPLRADTIPGSSSIDNIIVFDDSSTWILRRPEAVAPIFMRGNIFRDFETLRALWGTDVPVPRPVISCTDPSRLGFSFTMVQYVPGLTLRNESDLLSVGGPAVIDRCVDNLVQVLADVHSVDPGTVAFGAAELPADHLVKQAHWWRDHWNQCGFTDTAHAGDVQLLQERLIASAPPPADTSLIHGQFRIDNAILAGFDATVVRGIVDWKGAAVSDPLTDVALMCAYRNPIADHTYENQPTSWSDPMVVSADEIAQRYSRASGRELDHWPFHMALAYLKLTTLAAVRQQYRAARHSAHTTETVGALAAAGLSTLAR